MIPDIAPNRCQIVWQRIESLVALIPQYGNDPRLRASIQRLGERLLARAAFSTTAGDFAEAARLLDAADSLGVLAPEIVIAREALATAMQSDEGVVDAAGKTWTMIGPEQVHPANGQTMQKKSVIRLEDADHHSLEMSFIGRDGEHKVMEIRYVREV